MTESKIEWTGRSDWNPVRGCTRVSPGCGGPGPHGGCYAEAIAARFSDPGQAFHGFAKRTQDGGRWTGKVEIQWDRIGLPLAWRKPAVIFANSTSDIFHEKLTDEEIASIYAVAVAAHHLRGHTTQIVTKRPARAAELTRSEAFWDIVNGYASMHVMERVDPLDRRSGDARATLDDYGPDKPAPGVWIGVSVEDQNCANQRRDDTRGICAVLRFVSYEPALGPVDWSGWEFIDWIISGGESGPRARPSHPDWHRATRDFCAANGIAYFFKQWGEWSIHLDRDVQDPDWRANYMRFERSPRFEFLNLAGGCGFHGERLHVMERRGKRLAGRLLDGVQHDGIPA